jgi:hypothetical protein
MNMIKASTKAWRKARLSDGSYWICLREIGYLQWSEKTTTDKCIFWRQDVAWRHDVANRHSITRIDDMWRLLFCGRGCTAH